MQRRLRGEIRVAALLAAALGIFLTVAVTTLRSSAQADAAPRAVDPEALGFSHQTHVTDVGLDCQLCHAYARRSSGGRDAAAVAVRRLPPVRPAGQPGYRTAAGALRRRPAARLAARARSPRPRPVHPQAPRAGRRRLQRLSRRRRSNACRRADRAADDGLVRELPRNAPGANRLPHLPLLTRSARRCPWGGESRTEVSAGRTPTIVG